MCCRICIDKTLGQIISELGIEDLSVKAEFDRPDYNVSPGCDIPILLQDKTLVTKRWGFGIKSTQTEIIAYNTRHENIYIKALYRVLLSSHRAIVPCTGYYEWKDVGENKIPHYFYSADGGLLLLAALCKEEGFSIITCDAADNIKDIHPRMPVAIDRSQLDGWISGDELQVAMLMHPNRDIVYHTVSKFVNSTKNNSPKCIKRYDWPEQPGLDFGK